MKSLLLFTTAALLSGSVLAQNAGSILVYGTAGYSSNKTSTDYNTGSGVATMTQPSHRFDAGLGVGYQLTPHWTVGVTASLLASKTRTSDTVAGGLGNPINRFTGFSAGLFGRYTKRFAGGPFFLFGQLEGGYVGGRTTQEYSGSVLRGETYSDGLYAQLYPAFGIQVSRHASLAFNFGGVRYDYSEAEPNGGIPTNVITTSNSAFTATFGQQANLTVQWYFGDKARRGPRRFRRMRGVHREPMQDTRRMRDYEDDEDESDKPKDADEAPRRRSRETMDRDDQGGDNAPAPRRRRATPPRRDRDDD